MLEGRGACYPMLWMNKDVMAPAAIEGRGGMSFCCDEKLDMSEVELDELVIYWR